MNNICEEILVTREEINNIVKRIAEEINSDYQGESVVFVSILNGSFMFASDLIKEVNIDCNIDFMQVSTYGNSCNSSGNFLVKKDVSIDYFCF